MLFQVSVLGLVLSFLTATQAGATLLSTSNSAQKATVTTLMSNPKSSEGLGLLVVTLNAEVIQDVEDEAKADSKTTEKYLEDDKSFDVLLKAISSPELAKMDKADQMISVIKLGIRNQMQSNTRFVPPHFFENEQRFTILLAQKAKALGIKTNQ